MANLIQTSTTNHLGIVQESRPFPHAPASSLIC